MPLRVGVIGAGYLGVHHARIYSTLDGVELAAVADTDPLRASETADKYGAVSYTDYKKALDGLNAVSIVTPTPTHFEIAVDCIRAGCDVLVEKPIAMTVEEADRLIEEALKASKILQVGHLERYNPAVIAVSEMVNAPVFIEAERVSPYLPRAAGTDVTLDLMIHDIDIVMSLLKGASIEKIDVVGARVMSDKVDVAKAWVQFEGGVIALITANRLSEDKKRLLKIYQKDSYVLLDYQRKSIRKYYKKNDGMTSESFEVEDKEPLKEELKDFVDAVVNRRRPKVSGEDGRNALKVAIEITGMINKNSMKFK